MDVVGVMAAYLPLVRVCVLHSLERPLDCAVHTRTTAHSREASRLCSTHTHQGQICCHNTDYVHVNGHDRTITVILAKHCIKLPDDGSLVIRNMLDQLKNKRPT